MKVQLKTLTGGISTVEIAEDKTVADLKQRIMDDLGYLADGLKLVFKGKVLLADTETLQQVGVVENEFLVLVGKKKGAVPEKPKPAAATPVPAPAPAPTPAPASATAPAPAPPAAPVAAPTPSSEPAPPTTAPPPATQEAPPTSAPVPTPAPAGQPTAAATAPAGAAGEAYDFASSASTFATGQQLEAVTQSIVEMGFPRDQVIRALRAAFNNPDRAVDYLMNGIPEMAEPPQAPPAGTGAPAAGAGRGAPVPAPPGGGAHAHGAPGAGTGRPVAGGVPAGVPGGDPAAAAALLQQLLAAQGGGAPQLSPLAMALASIPQFEQIRQVTQANPQLLQGIIQQLRQQNPQLFNLINQNPQEFVQLIQNGLPAGAQQAAAGLRAMASGLGGAPAQGGGGRQVIELTVQDKEAVDRLVALGFPEGVAAEAYLVCGKNEELAANFLFENGAEGMEGMEFDDEGSGGEGNPPQ